MRSAAEFKKLTPLKYGDDVMSGDLRDPRTVDRLLDGVSVLFHLVGTGGEAPLKSLIENNPRALHEIYAGAVRRQVRRVVFASFQRAFGVIKAVFAREPVLRLHSLSR